MMRRLLLLALLTMTLSGCLNPYAGDFNCPETDNGKCVSVEDAYYESKGRLIGTPGQIESGDYQEALYGRMAGLLKEPETPMVVAPKVMRVLMLPYEGQDEELYLYRYAYIFTDRPRWIMTDPLKTSQGEQ
jgi:conjugal transfer pilus assembly protein TraV